jgi:hypothetical protein
MTAPGVPRSRARAHGGPGAVLVVLVVGCVVALAASPPHANAAEPEGPVDAVPMFLLGDDRVHESSGIAMSRRHRLVWVHNDAGNGPVIFGLKPTGATHARVTVEGAAAEDWEDIAIATVEGRSWLYLNDVGDAYQVRKEHGQTYRRQFEIVRFPEPTSLPAGADMRVTAEVFPVVFDDREGVNVEAMVVRESGGIILVEKLEEAGRPARVWQIERPTRDRPNVPVEVATVPVIGASGADLSVDGRTMVVRDAETALLYDLGRGVPQAFEQPVRRVALPAQDQGEGVAFTIDGEGLVLSGEGRAQAVWFVPLASGAVAAYGPLETDAGQAAHGDSPDRWQALRATIAGWISSARLAWSLPVLGALLFAFGAAIRSQRRAGRSR